MKFIRDIGTSGALRKKWGGATKILDRELARKKNGKARVGVKIFIPKKFSLLMWYFF